MSWDKYKRGLNKKSKIKKMIRENIARSIASANAEYKANTKG
jgi:hypothetical protein